MNAAAISNIALQLISVVASSVELYREGAITEEEMQQRWAAVGVSFDQAVAIWKGAGSPQPQP